MRADVHSANKVIVRPLVSIAEQNDHLEHWETKRAAAALSHPVPSSCYIFQADLLLGAFTA